MFLMINHTISSRHFVFNHDRVNTPRQLEKVTSQLRKNFAKITFSKIQFCFHNLLARMSMDI